MSNERRSLDLGPIPSITIDGFEGSSLVGTADLAGGETLEVVLRSGAVGDWSTVSVFSGTWAFETSLTGPGREIEVRWNDADDGDQFVLWWTEP